MIEPEMAFYELTDNMDLAEAFPSGSSPTRWKFCMDELTSSRRASRERRTLHELDNVLNNPFKRVSYTEGVEILLNSGRSGNSRGHGAPTSRANTNAPGGAALQVPGHSLRLTRGL